MTAYQHSKSTISRLQCLHWSTPFYSEVKDTQTMAEIGQFYEQNKSLLRAKTINDSSKVSPPIIK